jgi:hypothetical protein
MAEVTKQAPRLRLTTDVDFSRADSGCSRCGGTGIVRHEKIDNPENHGTQIDVPVVCRCVRRNGGVAKDMLDRFLQEVAEKVADGRFAEELAGDIMRLPSAGKADAIRQLEKEVKNADKDPKYRQQVMTALEAVLNRTRKEAFHGHA